MSRKAELTADKLEKSQIEEQNRSYEKQLQLYQASMEETSTMRHDWENHLAAIFILAEDNHDDDVKEYVQHLSSILYHGKIYSKSGNAVVDAMVNYKCEEAASNGVRLDIQVALPQQTPWNPVDLSAIIGNLMDNAIRAVKEAGDNAYIALSITQQQGNLILKMRNPYRDSVNVQKGVYKTTKQDKEGHGIGLAHIKKLVEKYQGFLKIHTCNQEFSVEIVLF